MGITTREFGPYAKGSRLTTAEMDENFNYLNGNASGTSGTSGTQGTQGTSGTSGTPGTSGTSGTPGTSGTSGTSGPFQAFLAQREANDIIDIVNALEGTAIPDGASATYTKTIPLPFTAPTAVFGCLLASSVSAGISGCGLTDPPFSFGISSGGSQTANGLGQGPANKELRFVAFTDYTKSFRAQTYINNGAGSGFAEVNESGSVMPGGFEGPTYTDLNGTMIGLYNGPFSSGRGIGLSSASASISQEHTVVKAFYISGNNLVLDLKKRAATSGQTWTKLQFRVYNFS
jgi:hypothetical protein